MTAVPLCDGHDSAINTINLELIRHGVEVIYLGYHRGAAEIARAAVQEGVRAVGLSSYNGGHVEFFARVVELLRERGGDGIDVFGGGGGTITPADARLMGRRGVGRIFFAGTPLGEMVEWIVGHYGASPTRPRPSPRGAAGDDRSLARLLTEAEEGAARGTHSPRAGRRREAPGPRVVGITGPGGAGKTTLIDELVLRFLHSRPAGRVAVLSHDPSLVGPGDQRGALLGDRAAMIYSQNDRVFMRSLATRGQAGGLSSATGRCLEVLKGAGVFELILVETVGVGQEALPFRRGLVDRSVLVMSPDYGSRLQLQKIAMLDGADVVVVNKSDLAGAKTAALEVGQRLASDGRPRALLATTATRHRDAGVDELFGRLMGDGGGTPAGGEATLPALAGRGCGC